MNKDNLRKLTKKEAFAEIGLHPTKDKNTYFIENLIIVLKDKGLSITTVIGNVVSAPEDTYHTELDFIFTHNFLDYIIRNEDDDLAVYKKKKVIGNTRND